MSVFVSNSKSSSHLPKRFLKTSFVKAVIEIWIINKTEQNCMLFLRWLCVNWFIRGDKVNINAYLLCLPPKTPVDSKWEDTLHFIWNLSTLHHGVRDSKDILEKFLLFSKCGCDFHHVNYLWSKSCSCGGLSPLVNVRPYSFPSSVVVNAATHSLTTGVHHVIHPN